MSFYWNDQYGRRAWRHLAGPCRWYEEVAYGMRVVSRMLAYLKPTGAIWCWPSS